jgi:low affinity Fe/Cu permease
MRGAFVAVRDGAESVGPGSHHRELVSQPGQAPPRYPSPQHDRGGGSEWNDLFRRFSKWSADRLGSSWAFLMAALAIVIWAVVGPLFHYSEDWQLVINTGTTIITFLMVFIIQNTQNRDAKALHLKIDELLRAVHDARTNLVDLENKTDEELSRVAQEFEELGHEGDREPPPPL